MTSDAVEVKITAGSVRVTATIEAASEAEASVESEATPLRGICQRGHEDCRNWFWKTVTERKTLTIRLKSVSTDTKREPFSRNSEP